MQNHLKLGFLFNQLHFVKRLIETNLSLEEIFINLKQNTRFYSQRIFFFPETFVEIKIKNFTHPMKGTIEASVPNAIDELKNSVKEKAEHYTVVDLLRNDLSMVADWVAIR